MTLIAYRHSLFHILLVSKFITNEIITFWDEPFVPLGLK